MFTTRFNPRDYSLGGYFPTLVCSAGGESNPTFTHVHQSCSIINILELDSVPARVGMDFSAAMMQVWAEILRALTDACVAAPSVLGGIAVDELRLLGGTLGLYFRPAKCFKHAGEWRMHACINNIASFHGGNAGQTQKTRFWTLLRQF